MYNYDLKMLREKNQVTNVSPNNKWKFCNSIPIYHIINMSACAPIRHMARKKVNNLSMKKEEYQFKFGRMSYLDLKQNKVFKEKVYKCLSYKFDPKT